MALYTLPQLSTETASPNLVQLSPQVNHYLHSLSDYLTIYLPRQNMNRRHPRINLYDLYGSCSVVQLRLGQRPIQLSELLHYPISTGDARGSEYSPGAAGLQPLGRGPIQGTGILEPVERLRGRSTTDHWGLSRQYLT